MNVELLLKIKDKKVQNIDFIKTIKLRFIIKLIVSSILFIGFYHEIIPRLVLREWQKADFTYCYYIPFMVIYFIWEKRQALSMHPSRPSWTGLLPLALGIFFYLLGELGGVHMIIYFSMWFMIVGLCWIELGWKKLQIIAFPLFLILTTFPPPKFLLLKITFQLKLLASQLGVALLHVFGMSAYREGNIIDLGFTQLQVVDACSGLRYLIPLIILGLLLAHLTKLSWWKKVVLVVSTIPISIFVNGIRIASVGFLYQFWGPVVAEGLFHDFAGLFIVLPALGILLFEMVVLKRLGKEKSEDLSAKLASEEEETEDQKATSIELSHASNKLFVASAVLLSMTLIASWGIDFRENVPITQSLDNFPVQISHWSGTRQALDQMFLDELDLSDYTMIDYKDSKNHDINFYVAYYESQRKGESIHTPATCLPSSGWIFRQAGTASLPIKNSKGDMRVNRAVIEKGDYKQVAYYWFSQHGRVLTNVYQLKLFTFWNALTEQRTDGALIRLITPVDEAETLADAEQRLTSFARDIVPILDDFLPE